MRRNNKPRPPPPPPLLLERERLRSLLLLPSLRLHRAAAAAAAPLSPPLPPPHPHTAVAIDGYDVAAESTPDRPPIYRFLAGLVFRRVWQPTHRAFMFEFHLPRARPVLVVDLAYPESSLNLATFRAVSTNVIKGSLAVIPLYGPGQVVNAALERVFDFTDVLHLQHQAEALNLALEALMEMQQIANAEPASRAVQRNGGFGGGGGGCAELSMS